MRPRCSTCCSAPLAPHLLDIEVTQVLRRLVRQKEITLQRADQALEDLSNLVLERHDHLFLVPQVWQLRDSLTACDAAYVALSETDPELC